MAPIARLFFAPGHVVATATRASLSIFGCDISVANQTSPN
jgi:hypothetical protein